MIWRDSTLRSIYLWCGTRLRYMRYSWHTCWPMLGPMYSCSLIIWWQYICIWEIESLFSISTLVATRTTKCTYSVIVFALCYVWIFDWLMFLSISHTGLLIPQFNMFYILIHVTYQALTTPEIFRLPIGQPPGKTQVALIKIQVAPFCRASL